jgi:hypothetical protein
MYALQFLPLLPLAALACGSPAAAQLTLRPGDTYTATFSALPDSTVGYYGYAPSGGVWFHLSDYDPESDRLEFHIFEETPDVPSNAGGVAENAVDGTGEANAFVDRDGGAVFTMLEGSVTLEDLTFWFQEPVDETDSRRYTLTIVPAPEPAAALLVGTAAAPVTLSRRRRVRPAPS